MHAFTFLGYVVWKLNTQLQQIKKAILLHTMQLATGAGLCAYANLRKTARGRILSGEHSRRAGEHSRRTCSYKLLRYVQGIVNHLSLK